MLFVFPLSECMWYLLNPPLGVKMKTFLRAIWKCSAGVQHAEIGGLREVLHPVQKQRRQQSLMAGPRRFPVSQEMQSGRTGGSPGCPGGPRSTQAGSAGQKLWRGCGEADDTVCDRKSSFDCDTTI